MNDQSTSERNICIPLAKRTILRLTGADRQKWLHNFCTADIKALEPDQGCEAFILNVKGKTLAHTIVIQSRYDLTLIVIGEAESSLPDHLERYIITEDVQIEDIGGDHQLWYASGSRPNSELEKHFNSSADYTHALVRDRTIAVATRISGQRDWLFLVGGTANVTEWYGGLEPESADGFDAIRIAGKWPVTGTDVTSNNLPQEFRRDDQAISFTKGCYLGQETVARIDAIGHVNYFLVPLRFDGIVSAEGVELHKDDKSVGRVTSAVGDTNKNRTLALGFVRRIQVKDGATFDSSVGTATIVS